MSIGKSRTAPHEAASASDAAPLPSNRNFGLVVGGVAVALGATLFLTREPSFLSSVLLAAGATLVALALVAPKLLIWPNRLWMKLGFVLGLIMTPIVMGVVYVTTFMPIGLIMRLKRHDPLRRKRKPTGESYWVVRTPPGPDPATMPNQF